MRTNSMGLTGQPGGDTAEDGGIPVLPESNTEYDLHTAIEGYSAEQEEKEKTPKKIADIFQCPVGPHPHALRDVVKLPCGQNICKRCLPESYNRNGIERTWPGTLDRVAGLRCPCCEMEHPKGDCWPDYLSNRAVKQVQSLIFKLGLSTVEHGQELVEAFGQLNLDYPISEDDADFLLDEEGRGSNGAIDKMESILRREMDCAICHALLYRPWTTPCGHTFCQHCIARSLTVIPQCPTCRAPVYMHASPPNHFIVRVTSYFWAEELKQREDQTLAESAYPPDETGLSVPLFVCTASFPRMPTLLHVFEEKYRRMVRRVWEGGKHFGMTLPDRGNDRAMVGVHLRIVELSMLPDGRSLMETMGASRFRVVRRGWHHDGYAIAEVEDFDDVCLYEEENREAAELGAVASEDFSAGAKPATRADLDRMSTRAMMEYAYAAILEMRERSPPWLHARILAVYGQCPMDPSLFPWWLGSVIPLDEGTTSVLLEKVTVRERMKICCGWILDWNQQRHSW